MLTPEQEAIAQTFLVPFETPEHLRAWCHSFLDIDFPLGSIDPGSNSSPSEWLFEAYKAIQNNEGDVKPTFVVYSSRDSYKCQIKGTKVLTLNGLVNIEDINIGDTVWSGKAWRKVTNWIDDGTKAGIRLTLRNGLSVTGSPIHRYWGMRNGEQQWIRSNQLQEGDLICVDINSQYGQKEQSIKQDEYDVGYFLGILIGDGSLSFLDNPKYQKNKAFFALTTVDTYIQDFFFDFCQKNWAYTPSKATDGITYRVAKKEIVNWLRDTGIKSCTSSYKEIPPICYKSHSVMIGFINGVFDTDGTFPASGGAMFSMSAGELLKQMQTVLISYGIDAKLRTLPKIPPGGNHKTHQLTISGNESNKLAQLGIKCMAHKAGTLYIPEIMSAHDTISVNHVKDFLVFYSKQRSKTRRSGVTKPSITASQYKTIPYDKLRKATKWLRFALTKGWIEDTDVCIKMCSQAEKICLNKWVAVTKTEHLDSCHFFDLTVEEDHSYWSNGVISHNTLSCAALEIIGMVHFNLTIAHMAAIESQSKKTVEYVTTFLKKLKPYLEYHGRSIDSQNTRNLSVVNKDGDVAYLTIIIATLTGSNSAHTNFMCVDEVDVVRFPQAYEEAKMIPGMLKGRFPITVMTSTRKFAFGLMQKEIEIANENGHPVLHWNILDITEKCQPERHKPELPKVVRYVAKRLPFRNMSQEEYDAILPEKKNDYEGVEGYAGCASCALFQVCRTRLAHRPDKDVGGLYKPISFTINQFKKVTPDMAEAQLLCLKPSSTGLVYPRFDDSEGENVLTLNQAWKSFHGTEPDFEVTLTDLIDVFKKKGIRFYVGGDWGFRHAYALIAAAILPSGDFWIFETLAIPGLEFEEMIKYAEYFRDKYRPAKWFMDTAQPMFIKGFRKRGMPCKDFKKDVLGGIEAIRGQIVDASNRRRLKILKTTENQFLVDGFNKHHFITDAAGNVTQTPDDEMHSDVLDSTRYLGQNLFEPKKKLSAGASNPILQADKEKKRLEMYRNSPEKLYSDTIMNKISSLTAETIETAKGTNDTGTVIWDFSHPINDKS